MKNSKLFKCLKLKNTKTDCDKGRFIFILLEKWINMYIYEQNAYINQFGLF